MTKFCIHINTVEVHYWGILRIGHFKSIEFRVIPILQVEETRTLPWNALSYKIYHTSEIARVSEVAKIIFH